MKKTALQVIELPAREASHCTNPYREQRCCPLDDLETLPYRHLGAQGLERLCFDLLLVQGYEVSFFGRSGQKQPGIDLVASKSGILEVFECKNWRVPPEFKTLRGFVRSFERKWLAQKASRPRRFVLCCPALTPDSAKDGDWLEYRAQFLSRTGVTLDLWHRDLLNGWLKRRPDIVADLFSDRHAKVFCAIDDWAHDQFIPVRHGVITDPRVMRYLEHRDAKRFYVHPAYRDNFIRALALSPVVVVRGAAGTGKTFTSLATAEMQEHALYRTYFIDTTDDGLTSQVLAEGIRRRLSRPAIFVLENCHERPELVARALRKITPALPHNHARVFCLMRRVEADRISRSDDHEYFDGIVERGHVIELQNSDELLGSLTDFLRPDLASFSLTQRARLFSLCGRDLYLLGDVLATGSSSAELEGITPAALYERMRETYFGRRTADLLTSFRSLSALAQFELRPRTDIFPLPSSELEVIGGLCVKAGRPPRWHFAHSSAAELVTHALCAGMGITRPEAIALKIADEVIEYFSVLSNANGSPQVESQTLSEDLRQVLRNGLKLLSESNQARLKATVLDSEPAQTIVARLASEPAYFRTVCLTALLSYTLGAVQHKVYAKYFLDALDKFTGNERALGRAFGVLSHTLSDLGTELNQSQVGKRIETWIGVNRAIDLVEARGSTLGLLQLIQHASESMVGAILDELTSERVERIVRFTLQQQHSISSLGITLRAIHNRRTRHAALRLEDCIGAARFLTLLRGNGTAIDLVELIRCASVGLARAILDSLTREVMGRIIQTSIKKRLSVCTLVIALRDLSRAPERRELTLQLGAYFCGDCLLDLVEGNGTAFELFYFVQNAPRSLAVAVVEALTRERSGRIIRLSLDKTRAFNALVFSFSVKRKIHKRRALFDQLEASIGASSFLDLIGAGGTAIELFHLIQNASPLLAGEVLDALTPERIDRIIRATVNNRSPIGILAKGLRDFRHDRSRRQLGFRLESRFGAQAFLRLVDGYGTMSELFQLVQHASVELGEALLDELTPELSDRIILASLHQKRPVATLIMALRDLSRDGDRRLLGQRLEASIGANRFLDLIESNGSIIELVQLVELGTVDLAEAVLCALTSHRVERLVQVASEHPRFVERFIMALRQLRENSGRRIQGEHLEACIGANCILELIHRFGTAVELFQAIEHSSVSLAGAVLDALTPERVERIVQHTIDQKRSIGALSITLQKLREDPERCNLGQHLELTLRADQFLSLTESNGTLVELFQLVQLGSISLAERVLDQLTPQRIEKFAQAMLEKAHILSNLVLTLMELRCTPERNKIGARLEAAFGADFFLDLIEGNGTVLDLSQLIQHASSSLAEAMVERLTLDRLDQIIRATVDRGVYIDASGIALYRMREDLPHPHLDRRLRACISAAAILGLFDAKCTAFELFLVMGHAPVALAEAVLDSITPERGLQITRATVDHDRLLDELCLALRECRDIPQRHHFIVRLEACIGADQFLDLIQGNGSVVDLVGLIEHSSVRLAEAILAALTSQRVERIVGNSIAKKHVIIELGRGLDRLRNESGRGELAIRLENSIWAITVLRTLEAKGTVEDLVHLIGHASLGLAEAIVAALSSENMKRIIRKQFAKKHFIAKLNLALHRLRNERGRRELALRLEASIGANGLLSIVEEHGTVVELLLLLRNAAVGIAEAMLRAFSPERVDRIVSATIKQGCAISSIITNLGEMRRDPARCHLGLKFQVCIGASGLLDLVEGNGSTTDLYHFMQHASISTARAVLKALTPERAFRIRQSALNRSGRNGPIHIVLSSPVNDSERQSLYRRLDVRIGGEALLDLIEENGTVEELYQLVNRTSMSVAKEVLDALTPERMRRIVQLTVNRGRTSSTLYLAFSSRRQDPKRRALGNRIAAYIGPEGLHKLIKCNGTVVELYQLIEHASISIAKAVIDALTSERMSQIIGTTLAHRCSIQTLHLSCAALRNDPRRRAFGTRLEACIGAEAWLSIIEVNGTVFELLRVLKHTSTDFAAKVLDALTSKRVAEIVEVTLRKRRPFGTLVLELRALREDPERTDFGKRLEACIGADRFIVLIEETGTVFDLLQLVQHASISVAAAVLDLLTPERVERIVSSTVERQHFGGTLDLAPFAQRDDVERNAHVGRLEAFVTQVLARKKDRT